MRKAVSAILLLPAVLLGFLLEQSHTQRQAHVSNVHRVLYYVDPMHPDYKSDKPGIAPDCGMPLEPVYADQAGAPTAAISSQTPPGTIRVDPYRQRLVGIRVAAVEKTSGTRALRVPGKVTADETRVYRINAGADGFVRETHEDTVGSHVKKDQRLATIYSPEFNPTIAAYLSAMEREEETGVKQGLQNWADRLRNLGMGDVQLEELKATHKIPDAIYLSSPENGFILARNISRGLKFEKNMEFYRIADLSHVWIIADLFENESQDVHPRTVARITLPDQKTSFLARVSDVLPEIDPDTRALNLRLEAENRNFALRPGMFVDVELTLQARPGLSVPEGAVLDSGLSKHVFVERADGNFELRQVETGERFGDRVEIVKGLAEGEKVVASGAFLVDSESRLRFSPRESASRR